MNVRKNFEGLFLAAAAVGLFASYASAETIATRVPQIAVATQAAFAPAAAPVDAPAIPTVLVVGHRLTAAEKARLG